MKLNLFIVAVMFLVVANAQTSISAYRIVEDKLCTTCDVPFIYNGGEIINYIIVGASADGFENEDLNKVNNNKLPNLSKYLILSGTFSLDFIAQDLVSIGSPHVSDQDKKLAKKRLEATPLQFSVLLNNKMIKDWTDIFSLNADKHYQSVGTLSKEGIVKSSVSFDNYHAGDFELKIKDSLVVLIRNTATKKIVESILIKRTLYFPQAFDFFKFSSDKAKQAFLDSSFQAYLKHTSDRAPNHINKDNSIDNLEMEPEEIAYFEFNDPAIQRGELEFALAGENVFFSPLAINHAPMAWISSLEINKPTPGETIELLLRYKQQPESVHHIIIKVHDKLTSTTWFKIVIALLIAALLFAIWYAFKRRNHQKQLKQLTLNKEEIESKLQLLSGQLNPHFLFNSLNSVQNLINKHDTENANLYVSEVSSFLRTIMDAGKKEYISLEEELSLEEAYMKLEQKRKAFNYNVINNCSNQLSQIEFPPSLLQPVIENSIHHGFSRNIENPIITIHVSCNEKQLIVSISDNGQGFDAALIKPGHGLAIVQKRISLMNEKLSGMPIDMMVTSTNKGTVTTFTFQNWL